MWSWLLAGCVLPQPDFVFVDEVRTEPDRTDPAWDTAGAPDPTPDPDDDGGTIATASGGCVEAGIGAAIRTEGWASGAIFHVFRPADAAMEIHTLELVDTDPGGAWDDWALEALPTEQPPPYVANQTSALSCADPLAFAVRLEGVSGAITDCVVWGEQPSALNDTLIRLDPYLAQRGGCRAL